MDAKRCIKNIRALSKEKRFKIGDIERMAGYSPGYLSRFMKENSGSMPSIEVLGTFASQFGVSIDSLIYDDFTMLSSTEIYLIDFLEKLIAFTKRSETTWRTLHPEESAESGDFLNGLPECFFKNFQSYDQDKELFRSVSYDSMFEDMDYDFNGESFLTGTGIDSTLYLVSLKPRRGKSTASNEIELYLCENGRRIAALASTHDYQSTIAKQVIRLYDCVCKASKSISLNPHVIGILDAYLNRPVAP